jgi:hypothetical protein
VTTTLGTLKSVSLALRDLSALAGHDRSPDDLTQPRIGHGEAHSLDDVGMGEQGVLDLPRRDLLAASVDDLLRPADE